MKKVLLAIDDTKGSVRAAETLAGLCSAARPEVVILVYVEKLLGRSLLGEGLESDPDIEELNEALKDTDYKEKLDRRARKIVDYYTKILEQAGIHKIKPVIKVGHPAEEILAVAAEESAELIVLGSRGRRRHDFLIGSVSREVANTSPVSVLLAR